MASYTAPWTENISLFSEAIANGGNQSGAMDLAASGYYAAAAQVAVDIASGSPNGDIVIELFGSADSGTTLDTVPLLTRRLTFTATGNKKVTIAGIVAIPYVSLKVSNGTGVSATVTVKWAGMLQASA